ncbi:MAG: hypothetical protein GYB66_07630 [Chloroflexi bacterium]|nr:hypothetical protein [Chloroflexota bacterium]
MTPCRCSQIVFGLLMLMVIGTPFIGGHFRPRESVLAGSDIYQQRSLDEVERWFYYLDVNVEDETVEQIAASEYDLVVIDYSTRGQ